jgi:hypothetical protein
VGEPEQTLSRPKGFHIRLPIPQVGTLALAESGLLQRTLGAALDEGALLGSVRARRRSCGEWL